MKSAKYMILTMVLALYMSPAIYAEPDLLVEDPSFETIKFEEISKYEQSDLTETMLNPFRGNGLYLGYGTFQLMGEYAEQYQNTTMTSITVGMYRFNFYGFSPELHLRTAEMQSQPQDGYYDSTISLTQVLPAITYRYSFGLPRFLTQYKFFKQKMTIYGRFADGLTRVAYESTNGDVIVETINTTEVSAGFTYPVYGYCEVGMDLGYRRVFTAGVPLEALSVSLMVGVKL